MSGFFRRVGESSDSESELSDDGGVAPLPQTQQRAAPKSATHLLMSDSEEETKRVVRTAKDKRYCELKDIIKMMKNAKKIKDMCKVLSLFEDLARSFEKAKTVVAKEGGIIPRFFIRTLVELEEFVNENWEDREARKNMSKNNARGLTTLRQKLRKYIRDFEDSMMDYRVNPDPEGYSSEEASVAGNSEDEEDDDDDDDDSESEDEAVKYLKKKEGGVSRGASGAAGAGSDGDSEDSDWESSSSESDEAPDMDDLELKDMEKLRQYFLKKAPHEKDAGDAGRKETKLKRQQEARARRKDRMDADEEGEWTKIENGMQVTERPKLFEKDAEITHDAIVKKLAEILAARGKKGTDRRQQVEILHDLYSIAEANNLGPGIATKVMFAILASLFDYNPKVTECMNFNVWKKAMSMIGDTVGLLSMNPGVHCSDEVPDDKEDVVGTEGIYLIKGCIVSMLERLDDEFTRILQNADCHSTDYVDKLKGEVEFTACAELLITYLEGKDTIPTYELCRIYMRQIEHLYYKFDNNSLEGVTAPDGVVTHLSLMERICKYIYANDNTRRLRARSMLCHIYHLALHERWHEARDMMLMSHLQPTIDHSDIFTQILYNRAICQLGLCAFRHGYIREAHHALSDIQNGGKARELLAQGLSMRNQQDRTIEQEKLEKQRQVPYHMHINLELLECVYLIAAMLLEIPQIASKEFEVRRRLISRSFHYQLKQSERLSLRGPPENTREHVVAAARALLNGNWVACRDYIVNDKMNSKVWNLFHRSEAVRSMLIKRIQEESLRTYLLTYSAVYDAISLNSLAVMFEMDKMAVHALISKMIIGEELAATLDEPKECVVMHRVEPSRLQTLSLQLTEKLNGLADNNEQIADPRAGQSFAYRTDRGNWQQQRQQQGGQQRQQQGGQQRQQGQQRQGQQRQQDRRQGYGQGRDMKSRFY